MIKEIYQKTEKRKKERKKQKKITENKKGGREGRGEKKEENIFNLPTYGYARDTVFAKDPSGGRSSSLNVLEG